MTACLADFGFAPACSDFDRLYIRGSGRRFSLWIPMPRPLAANQLLRFATPCCAGGPCFPVHTSALH